MDRKLTTIGILLFLFCFVLREAGFSENGPGQVEKIQIRITEQSEDISVNDSIADNKIRVIAITVLRLLSQNVYEEFKPQIRSEIFSSVEKYLLSFQIDPSENNTKIATGLVKTAVLSNDLLALSIPLKTMPRYNIALIRDGVSANWAKKLEIHLAKFNIRVLTSREIKEGQSFASLSKKIFQQSPSLTTIYFVRENRIEVAKTGIEQREVSLQVFLKGSSKALVRLSFDSIKWERLKNPAPDSESADPNQGITFDDYFFRQLNPISLKTASYKRTTTSLSLKILAPIPFTELSEFDSKVLKKNTFIQNHFLESLTSDEAIYQLKLFAGKENAFVNSLKKTREFSFRFIQNSPEEITLSKFQQILGKPSFSRTANLNEGEQKFLQQYFSGFSEVMQEKEKNNNVEIANRLGIGKIIKGTIENRLDQDLFLLETDSPREQLTLNLLIANKSSFQPKIDLYNENLEKLREFLPLEKKYQQFFFGNLNIAPGKKIYLRIYDKVGYIGTEKGRTVPLQYYLRIQGK